MIIRSTALIEITTSKQRDAYTNRSIWRKIPDIKTSILASHLYKSFGLIKASALGPLFSSVVISTVGVVVVGSESLAVVPF